jgi:hypothetical protein
LPLLSKPNISGAEAKPLAVFFIIISGISGGSED